MWILWGLKYRNLFEIDSFTFLKLSGSLFIHNYETWKWEKKSFTEAWNNFQEKFPKGLKSLLIFLAQISMEGKRLSIQNINNSGGSNGRKIKLTSHNLKQFAKSVEWIPQEEGVSK
ncbi:hypothetical protein MSUIS_06930 [Mycoplasma suis KI3806]|uniref:Uncharacterized protein n=1 Tax=Mycoplasma suis (strain KI_3806) TaxID=708248 RepID=F0V2A5_MYCS3|nr:hypothetical protein [Mycoplasma suis]CBZ40786.1 hypothetical protein MSUIS_06930 [Mycoplasma suis KI3806]